MKNSKVFILALVLAVFAISFSTGVFNAEAAMKESAAVKFFAFNAANNDLYRASFDGSGRLVALEAKDASAFCLDKKVSREEAVRAAVDFVDANAGMLGIEAPQDLRVAKVENTGRITHVIFSHNIGGLPVEGSGLAVRVNGALRIAGVDNCVVHAVKATAGKSSVSEAEAAEIAKSHFGCTEMRGGLKAARIMRVSDGSAVEAIKVELPSKEPLGDFVCMVDASTGAVLDSYDTLNYAGDAKLPLGSIYLYNPLKGGIVNEPLANLTSTGNGLSGKWANIINEDTAGARPDANGNYIFTAEDTHFDEVMAYFHIDRIHEYFAKFGFRGLDRAMKVTVHYGTKYDNAYFSPQTGMIALGDGNKLNDLSKEETVMYHEYTHAVTNAIVSMPYSSESGAMNEAFSDYFSATMTDDPVIGEWAMAKMNRPFIRNLENKAHYPESIQNEVHYDSNIYGGALWDLRKALGAAVTDKITHFSRYYLAGMSNQKFADGLKSLLSADREHFGGANAQTIISVFEKRGIRQNAFVNGAEDYAAALRFAALEGDAKAAETLRDMENGNLR